MNRKRYRRKLGKTVNIGHYELTRSIGSGSYGSVFEAISTDSQGVVAIKRMSNIFQDALCAKRLLREVCILRYLKHPNVVRLIDIVPPESPSEFYNLDLVLEYAKSDLKKLIKSPLHLNEYQIKTIIYNLLCGLNYIHSANIIHRDLKPANILMNEDCSVKICDFGLSRTMPEELCTMFARSSDPEEDSGDVQRVQSLPLEYMCLDKSPTPRLIRTKTEGIRKEMSSHVVTRWYRAPEIILLCKSYTNAIDVWSVGCIISELCLMQIDNAPTFMERLPLFPGKSCYPLSPDHKTHMKKAGYGVSNMDQLNVIFDVIGTPSEDDMTFLQDDKSVLYLKSFIPRPKINLIEMYPGTNPELLQLMNRMLEFNPEKRITIKEALKTPYFDDVRLHELEKEAEHPAYIKFDDKEEISLEAIKEYFLNEIMKFSHPK
jgi:mitogen-activated protein kinase 1/3